MKFGKKPARPWGGLFLHHALGASELPHLPPATHWRDKLDPAKLDALGNDQAGDCVWAALLHYAQLVSAVTGIDYTPTSAEALALYSRYTGYRPGDSATDEGTDLVDALDVWSRTGFPLTAQTLNVGLAAGLDYRDPGMVRAAISFCGGAIFGAIMPESALQTDLPWEADGSRSTGEGHCFCAVDQDSRYVYGVTWGAIVPISYDWLALHCDQAFALFSPLWMLPSGLTPAGMTRDTYREITDRLTG